MVIPRCPTRETYNKPACSCKWPSTAEVQPVSYYWSSHVIKHSKAKDLARMVLMTIAYRANESGVAWPGLTQIAEDCNADKRSVRRALKKIPADELSITTKGGSDPGCKRHSTRYQLLPL